MSYLYIVNGTHAVTIGYLRLEHIIIIYKQFVLHIANMSCLNGVFCGDIHFCLQKSAKCSVNSWHSFIIIVLNVANGKMTIHREKVMFDVMLPVRFIGWENIQYMYKEKTIDLSKVTCDQHYMKLHTIQLDRNGNRTIFSRDVYWLYGVYVLLAIILALCSQRGWQYALISITLFQIKHLYTHF